MTTIGVGHHWMPWDEMGEIVPPRSTKRPQEVRGKKAELAQLAPSVAIRWANVAKEERPYLDYQDEYLRSPYLMNAQTLAARWTGLFSAPDIHAFCKWPGIEGDRYTAQNAGIEPDSEEFRRRLNWVRHHRFLECLLHVSEKLLTKPLTQSARNTASLEARELILAIRCVEQELWSGTEAGTVPTAGTSGTS